MQLSVAGPEGRGPGIAVLSALPFISGKGGLSDWISSGQMCRERREPGLWVNDCFSSMEFIFRFEMLHNLGMEH